MAARSNFLLSSLQSLPQTRDRLNQFGAFARNYVARNAEAAKTHRGYEPLIHPKGYVPKSPAVKSDGYDELRRLFRAAVRFISPAVFHPDDPGKNVSPNILSVELGVLRRELSPETGDPLRCTQCQAVFCSSDAPRLSEEKDGKRIWTCRYCGCKQSIEVDPAAIPKTNENEYIIVPGEEPAAPAPSAEGAEAAAAAAAAATTTSNAAIDDNCFVMFCVDVSGSMKGVFGESPKLACVANAVYSQMDALRHEHPNRRVCLITFGSNVVVSDGSSHQTMSAEVMEDWEHIVKFAEGLEVEKPISSTFDALADEVVYLAGGGGTALGPALLCGINIASRKRGSYVVLCTDGMANVGIGKLNESLKSSVDNDAKTPCELMYERFGQTAKDAGVTVSVVGIKGASCSLENLGIVADMSGGSVELADPTGVDFSEAMEDPVLATGVRVVLRVDPAFVFENGTNILSADIGNVKRLSQQQCALFSSPDSTKKPPSEVRIQCEITYTLPNGAIHLRVAEMVIPFMEALKEAVDGIDVQIVGGYVSRTAARLAHEGEVEAAGLLSQGYQAALEQFLRLQRHVNAQQTAMMNRFTTQNTRAQTLVTSSVSYQKSRGLSKSAAARQRSDEESANIYQMRSDKGAAECIIM